MPAATQPKSTLPQPPTAAPVASTVPSADPSINRNPPNRFSFLLDIDMMGAAGDQAKSQGISLPDWIQKACNDALRAYIGI